MSTPVGGEVLSVDAEFERMTAGLTEELEQLPSLRPVDDEFGGHVFEDSCAEIYEHAEVRQILRRGGLTFEQRFDEESGRMVYVPFLPDPVRAKACSEANDIPIAFVPDTDPIKRNIPGAVFADTVRRGYGPVGVANYRWFKHDLKGTAHFLSVAAGGKPMIEWIVGNTAETTDLAEVYDQATQRITEILDMLFDKKDESASIAIYVRSIVTMLKDDQDPRKHAHEEPMDEHEHAQANELRGILYEGLKRSGIHRPEIMPWSRWEKLGRRIVWAALKK